MNQTINSKELYVYDELFEQLHRLLRKAGYKLEKDLVQKIGDHPIHKCAEILNLYYDKRTHRLSKTPRTILKSSILEDKVSNPIKYGISETDLRAIHDIERDSKQGEDLFLRYNKNVIRLSTTWDKQDKLFNDWNMLHFHLGTEQELEYPRFYKRTRNVLIVYPSNSELLFIDILPHGDNDPEPWYTRSLVEIVHSNWPKAIAKYRLSGVSNVSPKTTDSSVRTFRGESEIQIAHAVQAKKNGTAYRYTTSFTYPIETLDGTVYLPFGGGLTSNGMRGTTIDRTNDLLRWLTDEVIGLTGQRAIISNFVFKKSGTRVNELKLQVRVVGSTLWDAHLEVVESTTRTLLSQRPL